MPLCVLQAAAAALPELAVALAEPSADEWGTQLLVSKPFCLGWARLACTAQLCCAWRAASAHNRCNAMEDPNMS